MKREQSPQSAASADSSSPASPGPGPAGQQLSEGSHSQASGTGPELTGSFTTFEERHKLQQKALQAASHSATLKARAVRGVKEGAEWLKIRGEELVESFKAQSRFFKYRVYIAALWLAFTASSAALALWPTNTMGARVGTAPDPADGSVIISLENESEELWRSVVIVLDGSYEHRIQELLPGRSVQVHAHRFKRRKGANVVHDNPPRQYKPQNIHISSKGQGSYTAKLEK